VPISEVFTVLILHSLSFNLTITPLKIKNLFIFYVNLPNNGTAWIIAFPLLNFLLIEVIIIFSVEIIINVELLMLKLIICILIL
jgi:hypothetical protein